MAKKNYTPNPDGLSAEDKALNTFAELMIEKISSIQQDWKKPWFSPQMAQMPQNLSGRQYNGMNSVILMLMQEKNGWQTSRYATFDRIANMNFNKTKNGRVPVLDDEGNKLPTVSIKKGEKSTPVLLTTFTCVNAETKARIKYDDYKQMNEDERAKYHVYPKMQVFHVFNLDQTNLKESRPDMYQSYLDEAEGRRFDSTEGMVNFPALDAMIEKDLYVCPIKPTRGDSAYYSISKDEIVVPLKSQFVDGESFYSNLLHEMSHASGADCRLGRLNGGSSFGSEEYSREELVAELTSALVSNQYGMAKHIKNDSASYLKSWLEHLQKDPQYIKTVLNDVKRSASFIGQRLENVNVCLERDGWDADFSEVREQNKEYKPAFINHAERPATMSVESQGSQQQSEKEQETVAVEHTEEVAAKNVVRPHFHR